MSSYEITLPGKDSSFIIKAKYVVPLENGAIAFYTHAVYPDYLEAVVPPGSIVLKDY